MHTEMNESTGSYYPSATMDRQSACTRSRDAVEEQNAGRKVISSISALFGGIIKEKALKQGIDLEAKWKPPKKS